MEYRKLGSAGLKVSKLCLGSMQFGWTADEELSLKILDLAWDKGINFIDTADIYSSWVPGNPGGVSEKIIGKWLKGSQIPRDQIVIATKLRGKMGDGPNDQGLSRVRIFNAVEASLSRLGTDHIDLYQAHWFDEETPIEETLQAFDDLIHQGKVRYIGASNYPVWRLMQSLWVSDKYKLSSFVTLQPHYNLLHRSEFEHEMSELCKTYGLGVIPYSPLAGGFLTGKYRKNKTIPDSQRASGAQKRYFTDFGWKVLKTVRDISEQRGKTISQIALAWLLSQEIVTSPIIGPRTLDQVNDNLGAIEVRLTGEEINRLNITSDWNKS